MNYAEKVGEISYEELTLIAHERGWCHDSRECGLCQKHKEILELKMWKSELITGDRYAAL